MSGREEVSLTPTHHRGDHVRDGQLGAVPGPDQAPIAHDGDAIGDLEHLLQPVRDVEHGQAVGAQVPQDREQALRLVLVERGVGLIEDEHPRAAPGPRG